MSLGTAEHRPGNDRDNHENSGEVLLSLAAHDLRTSLSVIKWYTEMLLDGDCGQLTDEQTKYLKTIQSSNEKAIDLIRSVLNVSRLNLDTFSVMPEELSLESVLKGVIADTKMLVGGKKVSIEESYGESLPSVLLDRNICLVIFRNLVSNAVRFSKENEKVQISVKEMKQGEECGTNILPYDSIVVAVTDSGIGIPEEDKQYVFSKPFYKASNATDENRKGAGLGLYTTKLILEKTGGAIWFTSSQDTGSTFYVAFPKSGMQRKEGRTKLD